MSNSGSAPEKDSFKSLLIKGLVGSVALVGTTAIPIVVQRSLQAPPIAPASSDAVAPVSPAQISPLPNSSPQVDSAATLPVIDEDQNEESSKGKGKKKRNDD
ncbi:hypothetical protein [Nodosilinea sp. LEGE 06152]|uniref:hypothetical protein n=1 Tax=Nodosilinea sp. LEGE 06152 TaxID=2777966 RepID=UPI00187EE72C|nr:hypothetical protein [Nodosilinea sp. LEGE 06152]